jgi:hypothetical protein
MTAFDPIPGNEKSDRLLEGEKLVPLPCKASLILYLKMASLIPHEEMKSLTFTWKWRVDRLESDKLDLLNVSDQLYPFSGNDQFDLLSGCDKKMIIYLEMTSFIYYLEVTSLMKVWLWSSMPMTERWKSLPSNTVTRPSSV